MSDYEELIKNLRSVKDTWQTQEEEWMLQAADAIEKLMDIPAVPQEMSVVEYVRERDRMCAQHNAFCDDCPVLPERMEGEEVMHDCPIWTMRDPDKAVAIIEKWAREHCGTAAGAPAAQDYTGANHEIRQANHYLNGKQPA